MADNSQALLEQVAQAFEQKDYRMATQLLKQLWQAHPENPWVQLYRGRLYEVAGNLETATKVYKHLLQAISIPKVVSQARQGLQRVEMLAHEQRQTAIAKATAAPNQAEPGVLVLEPIATEQRQAAAQAFGKIMEIDAYTARMQLPNRGWRIYRLGAIGELAFYGQQFQAAGIPAFWVSLEGLRNLQVFQVQYLRSPQDSPPDSTPVLASEVPAGAIVAVCQDEQGQVGEIAFQGTEVSQWLEGMLPIFERVVDTPDVLRSVTQRQRGEETQDYALMCDLHLPQRNCILRFCDRTYQFQTGMNFIPDQQGRDEGTLRIHWNHLIDWCKQCFSEQPHYSEFLPFAEIAIDLPHLLQQIDPHFYLL
ncbi:MAG: tetratricopeptide repeat protein, partial [Synechococcales bacterium]|nr:tetratricopeptide repeat protein [Synechococcales bacterium]